MKHFYLKGILLCLSMFIGLNLFAYDALIDGIYYNFNGDDAEVTYRDLRYNSYSGIVVIPESITYNNKTYSVTRIDNNAFNGCSGLTSVAIPSSVFSIGTQAFYACSDLTSITIPNSVRIIFKLAFYRCI